MDLRDGGARSRKLAFSVVTSILVFAGALLAAKSDALAPLYQTMVGGLLGTLGLYCGANVGAKVALKSQHSSDSA